MQNHLQHAEGDHHPHASSHGILPTRKDQSCSYTHDKCSSTEDESRKCSVDPKCWWELSIVETAHGERAPWRTERKEDLKDRRCGRGDAEGNGGEGDGHMRGGSGAVIGCCSQLVARGGRPLRIWQGEESKVNPYLILFSPPLLFLHQSYLNSYTSPCTRSDGPPFSFIDEILVHVHVVS